MEPIVSRVSTLIAASPSAIAEAFVRPERLTKFWLSSASAPLAIGKTVHWEFMVRGAEVDTVATRIDPQKGVSWRWSDGTTVDIDFEAVGSETAVTIVTAGLQEDPVATALDTTEGFAIVLSDLKTLLESGQSAGLVRAKARLIESQM